MVLFSVVFVCIVIGLIIIFFIVLLLGWFWISLFCFIKLCIKLFVGCFKILFGVLNCIILFFDII